MDVVTAILAAAAVLLIVAGLAKMRRPEVTAELVDDLGGPARARRYVVGLGAIEVVLGVSALVFELAVLRLLVGLLYVSFAAAVSRAMAVDAASCGCFGRAEAPPTWFHVLGNGVLAAAAFVSVVGPSPLEVMRDQPAGGIGFVVLVGVLAGVALMGFTTVPEALNTRRAGGQRA